MFQQISFLSECRDGWEGREKTETFPSKYNASHLHSAEGSPDLRHLDSQHTWEADGDPATALRRPRSLHRALPCTLTFLRSYSIETCSRVTVRDEGKTHRGQIGPTILTSSSPPESGSHSDNCDSFGELKKKALNISNLVSFIKAE